MCINLRSRLFSFWLTSTCLLLSASMVQAGGCFSSACDAKLEKLELKFPHEIATVIMEDGDYRSLTVKQIETILGRILLQERTDGTYTNEQAVSKFTLYAFSLFQKRGDGQLMARLDGNTH
jgi:hypothetical protein